MRIISGKYGRRRFDVPTHIKARPTTDFARENLFNVLQNLLDFEGMKALDLFAGTGAISFELASRGCRRVVAVENYPVQYNFIRKVATQLDAREILPIKGDVFRFVPSCRESSISSLLTHLTIYPNSTKSRPSYSMPGYWLREGFSSSNIQKNMISPICPSSTNKEYTAVSISVFSLPTKI